MPCCAVATARRWRRSFFLQIFLSRAGYRRLADQAIFWLHAREKDEASAPKLKRA